MIIGDLKELEIPRVGSIAVEHIDTALSDAADAAEKAAPGLPSDAVVWEEVEQRTSENTELSISFVAFMVAGDADRRGRHPARPADPDRRRHGGRPGVRPARRALAWPSSSAAPTSRGARSRRSPSGSRPGSCSPASRRWSSRASVRVPDDFVPEPPRAHRLHLEARLLLASSSPSWPASAGILSLTNAKSGALIGVLISVTTIPAASNIGVAAAYGDWGEAGGAAAQLVINLASIVLAGVLTLFLQRRYYVARRAQAPRATRAALPPGCRGPQRSSAAAKRRLERGPDVDLRAHAPDHLGR